MNVNYNSGDVPDLQEIDEFLASFNARSFMTRQHTEDSHHSVHSTIHSLHTVAYIDSQATAFVVPDEGYLDKVTDPNPTMTADTAGGPTRPDAIGDATVSTSMFDDGGRWHSFAIHNVWVLKSCNRVLYSQGVMKGLGITHRLDEGFIEFDDGSRKRVSNKTYAVELTFGRPADTAMVTSHPALRMTQSEGGPSEDESANIKRRKSVVRTSATRLATPGLP